MKISTIFQKPTILAIVISLCSLMAKGQTSIWKTPASATAVSNPNPSSPASIKEGKDLYLANCSPCHGDKGKGDGAAAASLTPPPADHTSTYVQKETDGAIFWKLSEGHNSMPSYQSSFTESQRWSIVNFIRTLAAKSKK
jgi:mono/diheme cytochrome c family protein